MSGHSKWSKIKRQKTAKDQKKGNLFTKLGQAITLSVREGGGGDPEMNFMLRMAIDKAREENMPNDTIERAIQKGLGEGDSGPLTRVSYDVVGKSGVALIVDCVTDNTNRTISEVRKIATGAGFSMGEGSINWQFEEKGMIVFEPVVVREKDSYTSDSLEEELHSVDEVMLEIMEVDGVEDVAAKNIPNDEGIEVHCIEVITKREKFKEIYEKIVDRGFKKIHTSTLAKMPKNKLTIDKKECEKLKELIQELEENPDVESVWSNVDLE